MSQVALCPAGWAGTINRWGHTVDGCLWATIETRSLVQGHRGKSVLSHVAFRWILVLTVHHRGFRMQIEREAAERSTWAAAEKRNPRRRRGRGAGEIR